MGFLDKIFGKKEEAVKPKEKIELKFEEIPIFLEKNYSQGFGEVSKEIFSKISEIKHLLKETETQLKELEKEKIEENEGNNRLRRIVITSKKTLIEKMKNLLYKLSPPASNDFFELNSYCENSIKLLKSEVNAFGKNIAYTGIVLKEPIKKLGERIKELNSVFSETKKIFDSKKSLFLSAGIKGSFSKAKAKIQQKSDSSALEKEISSKISSVERNLEELQEKLKKLESSAEAEEFKKLLEEKKSLNEKKHEMKNKLIELFYPIDKLLRTFRKLVESKRFILKEEEKILLTTYLSNPFLALKKDTEAAALKKLLNYIKESVKKGTISLKEKEKEKKISALNSLLEYDFFNEVFWKLNEIDKKLIETEGKISSLDISDKISSLEGEIISLKDSRESSLKESKNQKNKTEKISSEISSLKEVLEEKLSDFSEKEVKIS